MDNIKNNQLKNLGSDINKTTPQKSVKRLSQTNDDKIILQAVRNLGQFMYERDVNKSKDNAVLADAIKNVGKILYQEGITQHKEEQKTLASKNDLQKTKDYFYFI